MFKLNDKVAWESQSQGFETTKRGEIIEVVKAGQRPRSYQPNGGPPGFPRNHESYVIKVRQNRTYWPRVKKLRKLI